MPILGRISGMLGATVVVGAVMATPASAAIMMATFAGATPYGGWDYAGVFGAVGSLAYKPASVSFTYDTERGAIIGGGGQESVYGGAQFGTLSPILSATVTIDGATYAMDPSHYGYANSYAGEWTWIQSRMPTPGNNNGELVVTFYHPATGDLEAPVSAYGYGSGYLHLYKPDDWGELLAEAEFEFGGVDITYLGPSPDSGGVPEPATWALLIGGFGIAGAALRRRARPQAV